MIFITDITGRYLINVEKIVSVERQGKEYVVCTTNNDYFHIDEDTYDTLNEKRSISIEWIWDKIADNEAQAQEADNDEDIRYHQRFAFVLRDIIEDYFIENE